MFSALATRYDRANRILSFAQDRRWRRVLVRLVQPRPHSCALDVCTGTGDLALALARCGGVTVTGVDLSQAMLDLASHKAKKVGLDGRVTFVAGNALTLPCCDEAFDLATIAFGLRNLPDYERGLGELFRVLKPGGQVCVLEFSKPRGLWGKAFLFYLRHILPRLGGWITGQPDAYRYLDASIRGFPAREGLKALLEAAGFSQLRVHALNGGIALIHYGVKPLLTLLGVFLIR